jgi:cobalt-zinc-cadmium efflux system outer membrane protein
VGCLAADSTAQTPLTWPEIRDRFRASNPTLQAGQIGIEESKAAQITAYSRPNPQWSLTYDQIGHTVGENTNPLSASILTTTVGYLHERRHKRELRRDSAQGATSIAISTQADLERNLMFMLNSIRAGVAGQGTSGAGSRQSRQLRPGAWVEP